MATTKSQSAAEFLASNACVFQVHSKRPSWTVSVKPEDLGYADTEVNASINLGSWNVLPRERILQLRRIEQRARDAVKAPEFTLFISGVYVVLGTKVAALSRRLRNIEQDYQDAVAQLIASWEGECLRARHEVAAQANTIRAKHGLPDSFVVRVLSRVIEAQPDVADVPTLLSLTHSLRAVPFGDGVDLEAITRQDTSEMARRQIAWERERAARIQNALSNEILGEATAHLRARLTTVLRDCHSTMSRVGPKLSERSLNTVRQAIRQFRELDFTGDTQVETLVAEVDRLFGEDGSGDIAQSARGSEAFRAELMAAVDTAAAAIEETTAEAVKTAAKRFQRSGRAGRKVE